MYPGMTDKPHGKLRLMYECNPSHSLLKWRGKATSGTQGCDIQPTAFHQRTPLFIEINVWWMS
jgi:fructose-1,6-bisphosphatase I